MASPMLIVVALLGGCAIAQAFYIGESTDDAGFGELTPEILPNDKSLGVIPHINLNAHCAKSLGFIVFVARGAWMLKNEWFDIQAKRQEGISRCQMIEEPETQTGCIAEVEREAQEGRAYCYRSGFGLTVGAVITGLNVKSSCFKSDDQIYTGNKRFL